MEYAIFAICLTASLLGSLVGFGGGIFIVPSLILIFNVPIEIAIGVTAISLFPSSLISSIANWHNKTIDFKLVFLLELPTVVGAFVGALLTSLLPTKPLEVVFAVFLLFLSWKMSKQVPLETPPNLFGRFFNRINDIGPHLPNRPYKVGVWATGLFGALAGTIAGLFGVGGGILKTPIMLRVFKVPLRTATGSALMMIVMTSFVSGLTHYNLGHFDMDILKPSFSGFAAGALIGVWLGVKLKDQIIHRMLSISIFLAGLATIIHATMM